MCTFKYEPMHVYGPIYFARSATYISLTTCTCTYTHHITCKNEPTPISLTANIVGEQKSGQFLGGTVISRRGLVVVSMHFGCVHVAG